MRSRREFLSRLAFTSGALATGSARAAWSEPVPPDNAFSIAGTEIEVWLAPVTPYTLRVSLVGRGSGLEPVSAFPAMGLVECTWPDPIAVVNSDFSSNEVAWGARRIRVDTNPLRITVEDTQARSLQRLMFDSTNGHAHFELSGQPVFGLGEGGHQFDRRGAIDPMRNGQFKPEQFVSGGRSPIPWLISPAGWGIFFHHPMGTFDLTGQEGIFRPAESPLPQDIFLIFAEQPAQVLNEFALLTGMPHLPPVWGLGYQQSHRTLSSHDEVMAEAERFRTSELPCDVLIYLGTGYSPSGWNTGHGSFAFNHKIFSDPEAMFAKMHQENFRIVLHALGAPHDLHGTIHDKSPDPDDAAKYWRDHLKVFRTGIDGWWADDGDELFPDSRLARNRMYWEGALDARPNVRPFTLHRNGYAGLQRYGWIWSGDTNSTWETLRTQIASGLNTGLSGIPYWGTDTGGFFSTRELTAELYVRWFQFSSFCPLFRSHGRTWKLRTPWGWNEGTLDPIEDDPHMLPDTSQLHNPEVERICRKCLDLRYRLLPYTYSMLRKTHQTGVPLMRALWFSFPGQSQLLKVDDAYLWGDSLLVAPVTEPGVLRRQVVLPAGDWFDVFTETKIEGGRTITASAPLDSMPLFAQAGAIVPFGPVKQYAAQKNNAPLELRVYPGADGRFVLYEDDGVSMDHLHGAYSEIEIDWLSAERTLKLKMSKGTRMQSFTSAVMVVKLAGESGYREVTFHGEPMEVRFH